MSGLDAVCSDRRVGLERLVGNPAVHQSGHNPHDLSVLVTGMTVGLHQDLEDVERGVGVFDHDPLRRQKPIVGFLRLSEGVIASGFVRQVQLLIGIVVSDPVIAFVHHSRFVWFQAVEPPTLS